MQGPRKPAVFLTLLLGIVVALSGPINAQNGSGTFAEDYFGDDVVRILPGPNANGTAQRHSLEDCWKIPPMPEGGGNMLETAEAGLARLMRYYGDCYWIRFGAAPQRLDWPLSAAPDADSSFFDIAPTSSETGTSIAATVAQPDGVERLAPPSRIAAHVTATWDHMLRALFQGLIPVVVIATMVCVLAHLADPAPGLFRFVLGFSVLGAALGLMLGASREPVVQAFLPAIITLASGLLVFVFPRSDTARTMIARADGPVTEAMVPRIVMFGLAALLLSSVTGAFWGGSIRLVAEQYMIERDLMVRFVETVLFPAMAAPATN